MLLPPLQCHSVWEEHGGRLVFLSLPSEEICVPCSRKVYKGSHTMKLISLLGSASLSRLARHVIRHIIPITFFPSPFTLPFIKTTSSDLKEYVFTSKSERVQQPDPNTGTLSCKEGRSTCSTSWRAQVYSKASFRLFSLSYSLCLYHALGEVSQRSLLSTGVGWCGPRDSTCCCAGSSLICDRIPAGTLGATRTGWHPAHKSSGKLSCQTPCISYCAGVSAATSQRLLLLSMSWLLCEPIVYQSCETTAAFAPVLLPGCLLILHKHKRQLMYEPILFPLAVSHTWRQQLTEVLNAWTIQVPAWPAGNSSCLCSLCGLMLMFPLASTDCANGSFFSFGAQ